MRRPASGAKIEPVSERGPAGFERAGRNHRLRARRAGRCCWPAARIGGAHFRRWATARACFGGLLLPCARRPARGRWSPPPSACAASCGLGCNRRGGGPHRRWFRLRRCRVAAARGDRLASSLGRPTGLACVCRAAEQIAQQTGDRCRLVRAEPRLPSAAAPPAASARLPSPARLGVAAVAPTGRRRQRGMWSAAHWACAAARRAPGYCRRPDRCGRYCRIRSCEASLAANTGFMPPSTPSRERHGGDAVRDVFGHLEPAHAGDDRAPRRRWPGRAGRPGTCRAD